MSKYQIGDFIRSLRIEKGLTQEQMAEELNLNNRTISRWENGTNYPDLKTLIELSEFFGVKVSEIIEGKRKEEDMTEEGQNELCVVAEYTEEKDKRRNRRLFLFIGIGFVCQFLEMIFYAYNVPLTIPVVEFIYVFGVAMAFVCGIELYNEEKTRKKVDKVKDKITKKDKIEAVIALVILITWFVVALVRTILIIE